MSNGNPGFINRFMAWFRKKPAPPGTNSSALASAVKTYVTNFRNIQSVGKKNNLYGNNFKNLPMNRPLIKALRNYIAAVSNFKEFNANGYGPKRLSKQNVLNAANAAIKAAVVANNKLENVATLRTAYATAKPLSETARQLYNQLLKNSGLKANEVQEISANGAMNRAITNSNQKLANLQKALNAAETAAGTGATPVSQPTTQGVAGYATNAAIAEIKQVLAQYNNNKINANNNSQIKFYRNLANLNTRLTAINKAMANAGLQGALNSANKEKLRKVKVILNQAKALKNSSLKQQVGNFIWDEKAYGGKFGWAPAKPGNYPRIAQEIKNRVAKGRFFNIKTLNGPQLKEYLNAKTGYNAAHKQRAQGIANALIAIAGN